MQPYKKPFGYTSGKRRPRVAVTMGDPAGIGPEVVLKALANRDVLPGCGKLIIGDIRHLRNISDAFGIEIDLKRYDPEKYEAEKEGMWVYDLANLTSDVVTGIESAECGKAAGEYIEASVELWRQGIIDAVATAPINKASLALGGYNFPGHTEFLASLTGTKRFAMSFFARSLRVVLLSTHVSLLEAIGRVKKNALVDLIRFSAAELERLLGRRVNLAVAGLNPHASEGGLFGTEEAEEIEPAVAECRNIYGLEVSGPYSPDTIFLRGAKGEFDAVIACYHDQATIAVKSLSFGESVNVTLGLPLVRTSVDHGTAFDIAGRGIADEKSMAAAIRLACELCTAESKFLDLSGSE